VILCALVFHPLCVVAENYHRLTLHPLLLTHIRP
jgi:hypothetical protein